MSHKSNPYLRRRLEVARRRARLDADQEARRLRALLEERAAEQVDPPLPADEARS